MTPEDKNSVFQTSDTTNIPPKAYTPELCSELASVAEILNKAVSQPFIELGNNLNRTVSSFNIDIKGLGTELAKTLESIGSQFDSWVSDNNKIFDSIGKSNERISKAAPVLYKHKWFITLSLPYSFVTEVSEIALSKKYAGMDLRNAFIHHFFDYNYYNTEQLVEGWRRNPLFEPRMKIFRDCLAVLRSSNDQFNAANVIIPALIAQIDGIMIDYLLLSCDFVYRPNADKGKKWKNKKSNDTYSNSKKAYGSLFSKSDSEPDSEFNLEALEDFIIKYGNDFILNYLFEGTITTKPPKVPFSLYRNKIMHGEYLKYGKKENLIRLFLALDFLYSLDDSGREAKSGA